MKRVHHLLFLYIFGLLVHGAWALTITQVEDWDPAYYRSTALAIAQGRGATSGAVWHLGNLPEQLPYLADLYWMPLPSRILVPLMWLWPNGGDQLTTVLLAASWGPLAYLIARELAMDRGLAGLAGVFAGSGLLYARCISTPDSVALTGCLGGLTCLAMARGRWRSAALCCFLIALCRNDGFVLAPFVALAFVGWRSLLVALSGPAAFALWSLRNFAVGGWAFIESRRLASQSMAVYDFVLNQQAETGFLDRAIYLATDGWFFAIFQWFVIFPLPATFVVLFWKPRWVRALAAYWIFYPFVLQFLAPGLTSGGSLFRSGALLFPFAVVIAIHSIATLGRFSERKRGYHWAFLPLILAMCWWGVTVYVINYQKAPVYDACDIAAVLPAEEVIFTTHPLLVEGRCGRQGVVLIKDMAAEQVDELKQRFGIHYAVLELEGDKKALSAEELEAVLPGWKPIAPRLYESPEKSSATPSVP
ncbi:MAG: hypothetical protein HN348_06360 [Proteobacteria bacterium]|nr:hypothetical protein [Pseudomonadota bacterium]